MIVLGPLGDRAFLARFATDAEAAAWAGTLEALRIPGVIEVALAYATVAVFADPDRLDLDALQARLRALEATGPDRPTGRSLTIPVLYDGEDLADVAGATGLSIPDVIEIHTSVPYRVFAVGFQPGFPYLGYLPPPLDTLPRRPEPRLRVPAGSVAIAARQTGIYPTDSPGGWHLLGRTPLRIVDLPTARFPIRAGDSIRFEAIDEGEFRRRGGEPLAGPIGTAGRP